MARRTALLLALSAATMAATLGLGQAYVPETPRTVTYAEMQKQFGLGPEAYAGLGSALLPSDPRIAQAADPAAPEQILVTYNSPTKVVITWSTHRPQMTIDAAGFTAPDVNELASEVRYTAASVWQMGGRDETVKTKKGAASFYRHMYNLPSFRPMDSLGTFYNYTSGVIHKVALTGLTPGATYTYQVGDFKRSKTSPRLTFKALPLASASTKGVPKVRLAFFADIAVTVNASDTVKGLVAAQPDLAVLIGDFAYANIYNFSGALTYLTNETLGTYSYQPRWDYLGRLLSNLTSRTPLLTVAGNHEIEANLDKASPYTAYAARYGNHLPLESSKKALNYWSTDAGPVHVIGLSPYVDFKVDSVQYKWLRKDLEAARKNKATPWTVVVFHTPWYSTVQSHFKELECHRLAVEPLFYQYGVDVVLHGHVHAYERTNRVYDYKVNPCGTTYITMGNAGVGLNTAMADSALAAATGNFNTSNGARCPYPAITSAKYIWVAGGQVCPTYYPPPVGNNTYCPLAQPPYSAVRMPAFGFGYLDVVNGTHAKWSMQRNLDGVGAAPFDSVWLVKPDESSCSRGSAASLGRRMMDQCPAAIPASRLTRSDARPFWTRTNA